jgi:hypothetical protein
MFLRFVSLPIAAGIGPENPPALIYISLKFVRLPIGHWPRITPIDIDVSQILRLPKEDDNEP